MPSKVNEIEMRYSRSGKWEEWKTRKLKRWKVVLGLSSTWQPSARRGV